MATKRTNKVNVSTINEEFVDNINRGYGYIEKETNKPCGRVIARFYYNYKKEYFKGDKAKPILRDIIKINKQSYYEKKQEYGLTTQEEDIMIKQGVYSYMSNQKRKKQISKEIKDNKKKQYNSMIAFIQKIIRKQTNKKGYCLFGDFKILGKSDNATRRLLNKLDKEQHIKKSSYYDLDKDLQKRLKKELKLSFQKLCVYTYL